MPTSTSTARRRRRARWHWRPVREVLEQSLAKFFNEDSLVISASIAYHSLLCIFPFVLLFMTLSSFYIQQSELAGRLTIIFERYLPVRTEFILENLQGLSRAYGKVGIISLLLLLWSSSGIFLPLEKALNRAWEAKTERGWLHRHLLALEMALVIGIIVFLSSVVVGVNVYLHNWMRIGTQLFPSMLVSLAYHSVIMVMTFSLTLLMFVVLFKGLPNRPMKLSHVLPSALLTAVFWEAARSLFTLLLPSFNYRRVYGPIGAAVALMTWIYISSAVTLFGAQVSQAVYRTLGPNETDGETA